MLKVSTRSLFVITCLLAGAAQAQTPDSSRSDLVFGYKMATANDRTTPDADRFEASAADNGSSGSAGRRTVGGTQQVKAFGYWIDVPNQR